MGDKKKKLFWNRLAETSLSTLLFSHQPDKRHETLNSTVTPRNTFRTGVFRAKLKASLLCHRRHHSWRAQRTRAREDTDIWCAALERFLTMICILHPPCVFKAPHFLRRRLAQYSRARRGKMLRNQLQRCALPCTCMPCYITRWLKARS